MTGEGGAGSLATPRPGAPVTLEVAGMRGIVGTILVAAFLVSLDSYIVNITLPTMARDFRADISDVSWVLLGYLLMLASTSLIFGKVADRQGLKSLFLWGYAVFLGSSVLCGLSSELWMLVTGRCLQGLGGAMLTVAGYAAVPRFLPEERRGRVFGLLATAGASGVIAGAPLGGLINSLLSWPWIFYCNVPFSAAGLWAASRFLPAEEVRGADAPFDLPGAGLSFASVFSLVWVSTRGHDLGWLSLPVIGGITVTVLTLLAFVWQERRCRAPLLDLRIFANGPFTFSVVATALAVAAVGGSNFLLPFYLEGRVGLPPQDVGFVLMVYCIVYVAVSPRAGRVSDRLDPRRVCAVAMGGACASFGLFALTLHRGGYAPALLFLVLLGVVFAFFVAPNNHASMGAVSAQERGMASGVLNVAGRTSLVLGISLFQAVYTALSPHARADAVASHLVPGMDEAFRCAYGLGAFLCLGAALASFVASTVSPGPQQDAEGGPPSARG